MNQRLVHPARLNGFVAQQEKLVFGVTHAILQHANEGLKGSTPSGLRWRTGSQSNRNNDGHELIGQNAIKSDAAYMETLFVDVATEEESAHEYSDSRKKLLSQRFNRLRNNLISHKN